MNINIQDINNKLKNIIEFIDNLNSISVIGTIDFADNLSKYFLPYIPYIKYNLINDKYNIKKSEINKSYNIFKFLNIADDNYQQELYKYNIFNCISDDICGNIEPVNSDNIITDIFSNQIYYPRNTHKPNPFTIKDIYENLYYFYSVNEVIHDVPNIIIKPVLWQNEPNVSNINFDKLNIYNIKKSFEFIDNWHKGWEGIIGMTHEAFNQTVMFEEPQTEKESHAKKDKLSNIYELFRKIKDHDEMAREKRKPNINPDSENENPEENKNIDVVIISSQMGGGEEPFKFPTDFIFNLNADIGMWEVLTNESLKNEERLTINDQVNSWKEKLSLRYLKIKYILKLILLNIYFKNNRNICETLKKTEISEISDENLQNLIDEILFLNKIDEQQIKSLLENAKLILTNLSENTDQILTNNKKSIINKIERIETIIFNNFIKIDKYQPGFVNYGYSSNLYKSVYNDILRPYFFKQIKLNIEDNKNIIYEPKYNNSDSATQNKQDNELYFYNTNIFQIDDFFENIKNIKTLSGGGINNNIINNNLITKIKNNMIINGII